MKKQNKVKVGERFGRLIVVRKSKKKIDAHALYKCKCDCGSVLLVRGFCLRNSNTQSCGCYNKDRIRESSRLPVGVASYNILEGTYKGSAWQRMIPYKLTSKYFKRLISMNCYYCGVQPKYWNPYYTSKRGSVSKEWADVQGIYVNGIDRVDNSHSIGYIKINCVACCSDCNDMKKDKTQKEFIEHINRVYKYQIKKEKQNGNQSSDPSGT